MSENLRPTKARIRLLHDVGWQRIVADEDGQAMYDQRQGGGMVTARYRELRAAGWVERPDYPDYPSRWQLARLTDAGREVLDANLHLDDLEYRNGIRVWVGAP